MAVDGRCADGEGWRRDDRRQEPLEPLPVLGSSAEIGGARRYGARRQHRQRMRARDGAFRRDHLRALAQRVEVAERQVRIMGSRNELLRILASSNGLETAAHCVRIYVPGWRKGWDSTPLQVPPRHAHNPLLENIEFLLLCLPQRQHVTRKVIRAQVQLRWLLRACPARATSGRHRDAPHLARRCARRPLRHAAPTDSSQLGDGLSLHRFTPTGRSSLDRE